MGTRQMFMVLAASLWLSGAVSAPGHAIRHERWEGATSIRWLFDDGRPVKSCKVVVFAPGSDGTPYQEGLTDLNGSFAFTPNTNGRWKVTVDDGQGHRVDVFMDVDEQGRREAGEPHRTGTLSGAVAGVGILFGCFGLYAMFAKRSPR